MERSALSAHVNLFDGLRLDARAFVHRGERIASLGSGPISELTILGSAEQMRELAVRALAAAEHADSLPEPVADALSEPEPAVGVAA
jgi:hypothetical protein